MQGENMLWVRNLGSKQNICIEDEPIGILNPGCTLCCFELLYTSRKSVLSPRAWRYERSWQGTTETCLLFSTWLPESCIKFWVELKVYPTSIQAFVGSRPLSPQGFGMQQLETSAAKKCSAWEAELANTPLCLSMSHEYAAERVVTSAHQLKLSKQWRCQAATRASKQRNSFLRYNTLLISTMFSHFESTALMRKWPAFHLMLRKQSSSCSTCSLLFFALFLSLPLPLQ